MRKEQMEGFTKISFSNMLDHLWDKKTKTILSEKSIQNIENAYFCCRPSESASLNKEPELTEEEMHINQLLFESLNDRTVEEVARQLKKVDVKKNEEFIVSSFARFSKIGTFTDLDNVSYLLSALYETWMKPIVIRVCEKVESEILSGLQGRNTTGYQSRIQQMNFLSTLYYFNIVKTQTIFDVLYALIPADGSKSDKSDTSFRIRLA